MASYVYAMYHPLIFSVHDLHDFNSLTILTLSYKGKGKIR
jgi:hypothetical protein